MKKQNVLILIQFLMLLAVSTAQANCGTGGCMEHGSSRIGLMLLSLVGGYWVLVQSNVEKTPLNSLGRFIGGVVLIVALAGLICSAVAGYCRYKSMHGCPMGAGSSHCLGSMQSNDSAEPNNPPTSK